MAAMRSTLPWVFGPPIDEEEEESIRRFRIECNELFLEGHDPESIMERWEDEQKRRKSSSGRRIGCVVEKVGEMFYVRKVVEVVKEIHKGGEKEMANGGAPACAGAACQTREEKAAANGDAPTCAQIVGGFTSV